MRKNVPRREDIDLLTDKSKNGATDNILPCAALDIANVYLNRRRYASILAAKISNRPGS